MEIYSAWSQLESYRSLSVVLGSTGLQTLPRPALPPPHSFLTCFQPNSVELIVLHAQDSCYCTAGCLHSNNLSDPCESLLKQCCLSGDLEIRHLMGF